MKLYCLVYLVGRAMPFDVYNKNLYKSFDILMNEKVFMNECMVMLKNMV